MDKYLFNKLFDRHTENPDFLRARVASVISEISDELLRNLKGDYNEAFYIAVKSYCNSLNKKFDSFYYFFILEEIKTFRSLLINVSNDINIMQKENFQKKYFEKYLHFTKHCGYQKRSRIVRRYNNFCTITKNYNRGRITSQSYRAEILNHITFFDNMIEKLSVVDEDYTDLPILLFVYDIRASQKVREKIKYL